MASNYLIRNNMNEIEFENGSLDDLLGDSQPIDNDLDNDPNPQDDDIPAADPGEEISFRVHLNTKDLPKGECLKIVTLTTNSPLRPLVNLFISGFIE